MRMNIYFVIKIYSYAMLYKIIKHYEKAQNINKMSVVCSRNQYTKFSFDREIYVQIWN
jgi:hypothetical protein